MERLVPRVRHYAWGSETAIPEITGADPDGQPWAELWIGDHPSLPSTVGSTGESLDAGLPFMLKILAAAQPLSIQTHPSLEQARVGFERENAAGLPIDSPHRTYRDPNHKPELICALTPFEALVGFRRPSEVIAEYGHIGALTPMLDELGGSDPATALRSTVGRILHLEPQESAAIVDEVAAEVELVDHLARFHPGDPGALVALLLHRIRLEPGEAVFLGAGNVHAYLSGVGVELMANSDNVVRGGLTAKHVDVDELLAIASFEPFQPVVQRASGPDHRFDSDEAGFTLTRIEPVESLLVEPQGPEVVLVTSGQFEIRSDSGAALVLSSGEAGYADGASPYRLAGDGVLWRAATRG